MLQPFDFSLIFLVALLEVLLVDRQPQRLAAGIPGGLVPTGHLLGNRARSRQ